MRTVFLATVLAAPAAGASWLAWRVLDSLLGRSLVPQLASLAGALAAGALVFLALARLAGMQELRLFRLLKSPEAG
jgi:hypothetical protein